MADREGERAIHPRERAVVMVTYVVAILPLFGILVAAVIALFYQQRSRTVVFHAKQAIAGQAVALLAFVVICLSGLFAVVVGVLSPTAKTVLLFSDRILLYALFIAYLAWHLYFAWMSLEGRDLDYPLIGARLRDRGE